MTYGFNASDVSNLTSLCGSVHDIELDRTYRLLIIYLTISLCVVGSILVVLWMLCNRRMSSNFNHLSRVNVFILYLTIADILVILFAVLPQLIWEYADRDWRRGTSCAVWSSSCRAFLWWPAITWLLSSQSIATKPFVH